MEQVSFVMSEVSEMMHNSLLTSVSHKIADAFSLSPSHINTILNFYSAYLIAFFVIGAYLHRFHPKMSDNLRIMWQQRLIALFDAFFVSFGATFIFLNLSDRTLRYDLLARNHSIEFLVSGFMAFLLWDLGIRFAYKSLLNMGYIAHHVTCLILSYCIIRFGMLEYYSVCLMMFLLGDSLMWLKTITGYIQFLKDSPFYSCLNYVELTWFIFRIFWANWLIISVHGTFGFANFFVGKPNPTMFPDFVVTFFTVSFVSLVCVFYYWLFLRLTIEMKKFRA